MCEISSNNTWKYCLEMPILPLGPTNVACVQSDASSCAIKVCKVLLLPSLRRQSYHHRWPLSQAQNCDDLASREQMLSLSPVITTYIKESRAFLEELFVYREHHCAYPSCSREQHAVKYYPTPNANNRLHDVARADQKVGFVEGESVDTI